MNLGCELLKPKPNPEIPDILRAIRKEWSDFIHEKDPVRRRGYAHVLIASLEALCDEPDFVPPPVKQGPGTGRRFLFDPRLHTRVAGEDLLAETPFDAPGEGAGVYFLLTRAISSVCSRHPVDPYLVEACRTVGYSYGLERRYVTPQPTRVRLPGSVIDKLIARLKPRKGSAAYRKHMLLIDPMATDDQDPPSGIHVGTYQNLPAAIRAARKLSEQFSARFLVATVQVVLDGH